MCPVQPAETNDQTENIVQFVQKCLALLGEHAQEADAIQVFGVAAANVLQRFDLLQFCAEYQPRALQHHRIHVGLQAGDEAQQPMANVMDVHELR